MSSKSLELLIAGQVYALHSVVRILAINQMRSLNGVPILDVKAMLELIKSQQLDDEPEAEVARDPDFRKGIELGLAVFDNLADEVVLARVVSNDAISNERTSSESQ